MQEKDKLIGTIKMFNGQFGFIKSNIGDIFFHKNDVTHIDNLKTGDLVSFYKEPSTIKKNSLQARNIQILPKSSLKSNKYPKNIGEIDWYNNKGFGLIKNKLGEYFVHVSNIKSKPKLIEEGDICMFDIIPSKRDSEKQDAISVIFLKELNMTQELEEIIKTEINGIEIIDNTTKYEYVKKMLDIIRSINQNYLIENLEIIEPFKFLLWLENYLEEIDLNVIVTNIFEVTYSYISLLNNSYSKIFTRLKSEFHHSQILLLLLDKFNNIDDLQKYKKIKAILAVEELSEQTKKDFLLSSYVKSDAEYKFLLWFERYIDEVDIEIIVNSMLDKDTINFFNLLQEIYERLNYEEQSQFISLFLYRLGRIDNNVKYEKVKAILKLKELSEQTINDIVFSVCIKSDNEHKFLLWSEKYLDKIELEIFVDKMLDEHIYYNLFQRIFERITCDEQWQLMLLFLDKLGCIDNKIKYEKVITVLKLKEVSEQMKKEFLCLVALKSDNEHKFLFWSEKHLDKIDVEIILDKMLDEHIYSHYSFFQRIFERIDCDEQSKIVSLFLDKLKFVDNNVKYEKVAAILKLEEVLEQVKKDFLQLTLAKSDSEHKFLLWYDGMTQEFDLEYIIDGIAKYKFKKFSYPVLFSHLPNDSIKNEVVNEVSKRLDSIDNIEKYNKTKELLTLILNNNKIENITQKIIIEAIALKSSYVNKLRLCKDFNQYFCYNIEIITQDALNCKERVLEISMLLDYLIESKLPWTEKTTWLNTITSELGVSNSLAFLHEISKVLLVKPIKNKFAGTPLMQLIGVKNEIEYVNNNLSLFPLEYHTQITSFTNRRYSRWVHTQVYTDKILCVEYLLNSEILSNQSLISYYQSVEKNDYIRELEYLKSFKELHLILGNDKNELLQILIPSFITKIKTYIGNFQKPITENLLLNPFKNIKYLIDEFLDTSLKNELDALSIDLKLKLWIYDIIEYFNFNQFCFYYFTLNSFERSIFNKKAKAIMGETLKQSMLKQREPWVLAKVDKENSIYMYSATWRSIWFDDKKIKFCIDSDCNFSRAYTWDFSEEKFNLLFDYISGRKLKHLVVWVKNNFILKVEGLEDLEEVIWKVQIQKEIQTSTSSGIRNKSGNRIPINMVLRNQCIQLLNQFQLNELEPTRVLEKTFNLEKNGLTIDISLLYSIPINKSEIAIIWESLELEKSKATHIFKCSRDEYSSIFSDIEFYLQNKSKVRSSLNSNHVQDVERQKKMRYLCRIDHDNFDFSKWEASLYEALPELSLLIKNKEE